MVVNESHNIMEETLKFESKTLANGKESAISI
jgi:hypothetical protein